MLKFPLLLPGILFFAVLAKAQTPKLYKDAVFTDVTLTRDLSYNLNPQPDEKKSYLFDLSEPKGDNSTKRPLIIWMHGGGFKFGTKEAKGIQLWSKTFAQRGYVCAAINYRLSKKNPLFHFDVLKQGCYYAVLDAKTAVAYFKENSKQYNIDPEKIILAGNSAGGMIALMAAYSTNSELAKVAGINDSTATSNDLLKIAGVINFWGSIFDINWLRNANTPIVSVYGSKDSIMPPKHTDKPLYGSIDVNEKANTLGIPNKIKVFDGYAHELQKHFNPLLPVGKGTRERWLEAGQFCADFFYDRLFDDRRR